MSNYVEDTTVDTFSLQTTQACAEAMEFAIDQSRNNGGTSEEEDRQAAQDALMELTRDLTEAVASAYTKTPLRRADHEAIATVFEKLAIKAKVEEYKVSGELITVTTRKETHRGVLTGMTDEEGEPTLILSLPEGGFAYVPEVAVLSLTS